MLLMTDAAMFVVSGVFMAAHTIMRTINAATVVMVERLAGNGK
jgi:small neutral amino acid transporter SnatA (MarC family)